MSKFFSMKILFLSVFISLFWVSTYAQETIAKFKYEDAEKAFISEDYETCISLLNETEKLLGQTAPNILHLKILTQYKLFKKNPYESYGALNALRNNCNTYLAKYDIAGLEEKYREVYEVQNVINDYPRTQAEFETMAKAIADEKNRKLSKIRNFIDSLSPMVYAEGGSFIMGGKAREMPSIKDTRPEHKVTLSDFHIGRFETTQKLWQYVMGNNPSQFLGCDDCPVESISWDDVQSFINKLNIMSERRYRLPTEAEWEYAARGGQKSSGEARATNRGRISWNAYNGYQKKPDSRVETKKSKPVPHPVGQKEPNELGLFDTIGNVMEWTNDWYGADYYNNSPEKDPKGPETGSEKVLRGGSYQTYITCDFIPRIAGQLKSNISSDIVKSSYGFRLAMDKE